MVAMAVLPGLRKYFQCKPREYLAHIVSKDDLGADTEVFGQADIGKDLAGSAFKYIAGPADQVTCTYFYAAEAGTLQAAIVYAPCHGIQEPVGMSGITFKKEIGCDAQGEYRTLFAAIAPGPGHFYLQLSHW